tara:strand:- start:1483 stop:2127 length:645 start_codon:yes stop_codon:yes gene_type:complete
MASVDTLKSLASAKLGFARTNSFVVNLPTLFGANSLLSRIATLGGNELNILCSNVQLPGKQILTQDRRIGTEFQKIAYGYAVDDVSMTFYALNDYGVRKYFDNWMETTVQQDTHTVAYKSDYQKDIRIHQLRKPIINKNIDVGPVDINIGLGQGTVYSVLLENAFPTTMGSIELNNEADGLIQVTVQFSYTKWKAINDPQGFISVSGGFGSILS